MIKQDEFSMWYFDNFPLFFCNVQGQQEEFKMIKWYLGLKGFIWINNSHSRLAGLIGRGLASEQVPNAYPRSLNN